VVETFDINVLLTQENPVHQTKGPELEREVKKERKPSKGSIWYGVQSFCRLGDYYFTQAIGEYRSDGYVYFYSGPPEKIE